MCKQPLPIYLATVFITTPIMVIVLPDCMVANFFTYFLMS